MITNNHVYNNWDKGSSSRSLGAMLIAGNTVTGNGFGVSGTGARYGCTAAESPSRRVAASRSPVNDVAGNCNGITATQQNRPDGQPGLLQNISVHNNTVSGPGGRTGAGVYPVGIANLATRDVVFTANTATNGMNLCNLKC